MTRLSIIKKIKDSSYTSLALARDIESGDYVVEKTLTVATDFQKELFKNEVAVHSCVENRYIIKFLRQADEFSFIMEYATGGNLEKAIESNCDPQLRSKYCLQFLKGLDYLHQNGWVHNDIKPSNILICKDNRAKLADFAFAGRIGTVTFPKMPPVFKLGTDFFRRPGINGDSTENKIQNDLYSVGISMFLIFSGAPGRLILDLDKITRPELKDIIRKCLDGTIGNVQNIIEGLTQIYGTL